MGENEEKREKRKKEREQETGGMRKIERKVMKRKTRDLFKIISDKSSRFSTNFLDVFSNCFRYTFDMVSMKAGHIVMHACQISLTESAPLTWDCLTRPRLRHEGML